MARTITWLHLSELHSCKPRTEWDAERVLRTLCEDLRFLQEQHGLRPDLMFFTGDLAFGHVGEVPGERIADQFDDAGRLMAEVRGLLRPVIPLENIFLVAGNHDVNRARIDATGQTWLERQDSLEPIQEMIRRHTPEWRKFMLRLADYDHFLQRQGYDHLRTDPERAVYAVKRTINGATLGIAGLNSAWSCCRDGEQGRLWLAGKWQAETLLAELGDVDIPLALIHHPHNWFVEQEGKHFWRHVLQPRFRFCLHGHEHDVWVDEVGADHITIAAAALYENSERDNGYNMVRLNLDDGTGEVFLRRYDPRGGGGWVAEQIPRKTDAHGVWHLRHLDWLKCGGSSNQVQADEARHNRAGESSPLPPDVQKLLKNLPVLQETLSGVTPEQVTVRRHSGADGVAHITVNVTIVQVVQNVQPAAAAVSDVEATTISRGIEAALELIKRRRLQDAIAALQALVSQHQDELTARQRFIILANQGQAYQLLGDAERARRSFEEAIPHVPADDKQGMYFRAVSLDMAGDRVRSRSVVNDLRASLVPGEMPAATMLWINTAPAQEPFDLLESSVPALERTTSEVAWALGRRALDAGLYVQAETYARQAVLADPSWPDAKVLLAGVLIEKRFGRVVKNGFSKPPVAGWPDYEQVVTLLEEAIDQMKAFATPQRYAPFRLNLAAAHAAIGKRELAMEQYRRAYEESPALPDIVDRYATYLQLVDRDDDAVRLLDTWLASHTSRDVELLRAQVLFVRNGRGDRLRASGMLEAGRATLKDEAPELRAEWVAVLVEMYLDLRDLKSARRALDETPDEWLPRAVRKLLRADLARLSGDEAAAVKTAREAASELDKDADPLLKARMAMALEALNEYARAMEIWQELAVPNEVGFEAARLVNAAHRAGATEPILRFCESLRRNGVYDKTFVEIELDALERVSYIRLIAALQDILGQEWPTDYRKELRSQVSYVALLSGRVDLIEHDPNDMPTPEEASSARSGRIVTHVLLDGPSPMLAVDYAYRLFRRFPDEIDAHLAVLYSQGIGPDKAHVLPVPERGGPGIAVLYKDDDTGEESWFIVEDLFPAKPSLNELAPNEALSEAARGKRKGEQFEVRARPRRTATIKELQSKYLRRWQDCLVGMERRFPDESPLWSIPTDPADEQGGLTGLFRQVEDRAKQIETVREWYRANTIPVHMFASAVGRTTFEGLQALALDKDLTVRCCAGSAEERAAAIAALDAADAVIVDPTAAATLFLLHQSRALDAESVLAKCPLRLRISEHTTAEVRQVLSELSPDERLTIMMQDGQFVRHVTPASAMQEYRELVDRYLKLLERQCEVAPGLVNEARADAERREEIFGRSGIDSMRLAQGARHVLWTDDLVVCEVARTEMKVRRVWSQILFGWLVSRRAITPDAASLASTRLLQMGYRFSSVNADVVVAAGSLVAWDVDATPLREALDQLADPATEFKSIAQVFVQTLKAAWQTGLMERQSRMVTWRALDRFGSRPGARAIIQSIVGRLDGVFGSDERNVRRVSKLLHQWLQG